MFWGRFTDRRHATGLTLAALALLVRLLFPSGFMLSPDRTARPTIVICTGQGAMTFTLDADGHKVAADKGGDHKSDNKTSHPCTFAAATVAAVAPAMIAILIPIELAQVTAAPLLTTQRPGLGLAAPPPPTTGPPTRI